MPLLCPRVPERSLSHGELEEALFRRRGASSLRSAHSPDNRRFLLWSSLTVDKIDTAWAARCACESVCWATGERTRPKKRKESSPRLTGGARLQRRGTCFPVTGSSPRQSAECDHQVTPETEYKLPQCSATLPRHGPPSHAWTCGPHGGVSSVKNRVIVGPKWANIACVGRCLRRVFFFARRDLHTFCGVSDKTPQVKHTFHDNSDCPMPPRLGVEDAARSSHFSARRIRRDRKKKGGLATVLPKFSVSLRPPSGSRHRRWR